MVVAVAESVPMAVAVAGAVDANAVLLVLLVLRVLLVLGNDPLPLGAARQSSGRNAGRNASSPCH